MQPTSSSDNEAKCIRLGLGRGRRGCWRIIAASVAVKCGQRRIGTRPNTDVVASDEAECGRRGLGQCGRPRPRTMRTKAFGTPWSRPNPAGVAKDDKEDDGESRGSSAVIHLRTHRSWSTDGLVRCVLPHRSSSTLGLVASVAPSVLAMIRVDGRSRPIVDATRGCSKWY